MDQEFFICESLLLSVALYFLMTRILENKAVTKKKQIAKQALYQWQNSRMIVKNHTVQSQIVFPSKFSFMRFVNQVDSIYLFKVR